MKAEYTARRISTSVGFAALLLLAGCGAGRLRPLRPLQPPQRLYRLQYQSRLFRASRECNGTVRTTSARMLSTLPTRPSHGAYKRVRREAQSAIPAFTPRHRLTVFIISSRHPRPTPPRVLSPRWPLSNPALHPPETWALHACNTPRLCYRMARCSLQAAATDRT